MNFQKIEFTFSQTFRSIINGSLTKDFLWENTKLYQVPVTRGPTKKNLFTSDANMTTLSQPGESLFVTTRGTLPFTILSFRSALNRNTESRFPLHELKLISTFIVNSGPQTSKLSSNILFLCTVIYCNEEYASKWLPPAKSK